MKLIIAVVLVVVSLAAAEPPRFRASARQTAFQPPAPSAQYNPRGWRPQGAALTLPRSQPQQAYGPPSPAPSYGPPPEEPTSTDDQIGQSTEPPQIAKISSKQTTAKTSAAAQEPRGAYFVVLPQSSAVVVPQTPSQNLVYAVTGVQKSAPLVAFPQATIVAAPLTTAQLQTLPVPTYKAVYSPLAAPYVQVEW